MVIFCNCCASASSLLIFESSAVTEVLTVLFHITALQLQFAKTLMVVYSYLCDFLMECVLHEGSVKI